MVVGICYDILLWVTCWFSWPSEHSRRLCFVTVLQVCQVASVQFSSFQFSHSVVSNSLQPHGLQHNRLPCPSPTPEVYSNSRTSCRWCHLTIPSFVMPFSSLLQSFPASGSFSNESVLCINWPKYLSFSFSISPSNEYSGLISFRMDWLDLLAVQETHKSSPTPQFKSINSSVLSFFYSPALTSIHDYWKNHSFDFMDLCQ